MQECKLVKAPIPIGARLFAEQFPKTQEKEEDMSRVPYASVVGSLMYAMVSTRLDISHVVGVLSRYMSKPTKRHWTSVKRACLVFAWEYKSCNPLPRKRWNTQSVRCTWLC